MRLLLNIQYIMTKIEKKAERIMHKNNKKEKNLWAKFAGSMSFISIGTAFLTFSHNMSTHKTTVPVYAPKSGLYFWFYQTFGHFMRHILIALSGFFSQPNNIGWAVIVLTIIFKLLILPLNIATDRLSAVARERRNGVAKQKRLIADAIKYNPINAQQDKELKLLDKKIDNDNKIPRHLMAYFFGINFLTSWVTVPLYQVVAYSKNIQNKPFYAFNLGQRSIGLAITVALISAITSYIHYTGWTEDIKRSTANIEYFEGPLALFASTMFFPSIIGLYTLVSQIMSLFRAILSWYIMRPRIRKYYAQHREEVIKIVVTPEMINKILQEDPESVQE